MPARQLLLLRSARKNLLKLPLDIHQRVIRALDVIKSNPFTGSRLKGELADFFKYRIGDYRIVYRFDKKTKTVVVVKIEHRRGVYR